MQSITMIRLRSGTAATLLLWTLQVIVIHLIVATEPPEVKSKWPSDKEFPKNREFGDSTQMREDFELVPPLGPILKLNTYFEPTDVNALNTKFTIHNRKGSSKLMAFIPSGFVYSSLSTERFHYNLTTMANSDFDPNKRTVIMISGFMTNDKVTWMERVKDQWLKLEDCNVIIVTWKEGNRYVYSRAAATTPRVARQITIFLHYLATIHGASVDSSDFCSRIHFVGHSLGCHIAAFVGQDLGGRVGRITALDPAGPSFDMFPREHRLDPSDALLVEALHTNAGKMKYASLVKSGAKRALDKVIRSDLARSISESFNGEGDNVWFGIELQVGHIDYYANNGKTQPGCTDCVHICDHGRSHHIYEGMLDYELALKEANISLKARKDKRLLAVNAADYAGFASGEALNQRCPAMLHDRERLQGLAEQLMPHCTIPLDQLTPVNELIEELRQVYGLTFANKNEPVSSQRYYLKTLAEKPFVGDHYLLRIKLERASKWDKSCGFQVELSYADEQSTTIELASELRLFSNGKFYGLSSPFVNRNKAAARLALDEMLRRYGRDDSQSLNQTTRDASAVAFDEWQLDKILPTSVSLKISDNIKAQSTISKWMKGVQTDPNKCSLIVNSIQVHPLVGLRRSLFGLYTSKRRSSQDGYGSTPLISHLEYQKRKHSEKPWPENFTPSTSQQSHERQLDLVVIG